MTRFTKSLSVASLIASMLLTITQLNADELTGVKTISLRAESWESLTYEDGSGYLFELIKAVYEPLGYEINVKICPWRRCLLDVIEGKADIVVGMFSDEAGVEGQLQISHYPVLNEHISVAFKRKYWPNWQGLQSLENQLGVQIRGYDYDQYLEVPVKTTNVSNVKQAWRMLMADRVTFYIDGHMTLQRLNNEESNDPSAYNIEPVYERYSYLGFRKTEKGNQLSKLFDGTLPKLYQSGLREKLRLKWGYPHLLPLEKINISTAKE